MMQQNQLSHNQPRPPYEHLKPLFHKAGFQKVYEKQGKEGLFVIRSGQVQVRVKKAPCGWVVLAVFPNQVNVVDIIATAILFYLSTLLSVPFLWIAAIVLGQGASYAFYAPKVERLKSEVERLSVFNPGKL